MRFTTVPRFVDTNVLLYAVSTDSAEKRKRSTAEAARAAGCTAVLSEELPHGRDYEGVTVVNPFR